MSTKESCSHSLLNTKPLLRLLVIGGLTLLMLAQVRH